MITESLSRKVIKGGFWGAFVFGIEKILGFARTVILTRMLAPDDFGLMGIVMVAMNGFVVFSNTGINSAIIQKKGLAKSALDTAWIISFVRGILLTVLLFLSAPLIANFYDDRRLILIIRVITIIFLLNGLKNIGFIMLQKELEFKKKNLFRLTIGTITTIVAIGLAIIFKNVWALVIAEIVGAFLGLIGSYMIHPFRPNFSFNRGDAKELLHFGKYLFIMGIIVYIITQGDDAIVGKMLGVVSLGFYTLAYKIANMFTRDIVGVISEVILPAYAKLQDEAERLIENYYDVLTITSIVIFFISGILFSLAPEIINFVYSPKWNRSIIPLQILCLLGIFRALAATIGPIFTGIGEPKILAKIKLRELILMLLIIFPLINFYGIIGAAIAGTIVYLLSFILHIYYLNHLFKNVISNMFLALRSPLLGLSFMIALIYIMKILLTDQTFIQFIIMLIIGTLSYTTLVLLLEKNTIFSLLNRYGNT